MLEISSVTAVLETAGVFLIQKIVEQTFIKETLPPEQSSPDMHFQLSELLKQRGQVEVGAFSAGLTYLGQLVAHDLLSSPVRGIYRSPWLDLQCLYGVAGIGRRATIRRDGSMPLGATTKSCARPSVAGDVLREANGAALIADGRNDENLIISQLHLQFQKLHNYFLRQAGCLAPAFAFSVR